VQHCEAKLKKKQMSSKCMKTLKKTD